MIADDKFENAYKTIGEVTKELNLVDKKKEVYRHTQ